MDMRLTPEQAEFIEKAANEARIQYSTVSHRLACTSGNLCNPYPLSYDLLDEVRKANRYNGAFKVLTDLVRTLGVKGD